MSQSRPNLSTLKRVCPQDLAHCEGYVWHLGTRIGKGSFGEVFLGWTNDGNSEVAVKVVRKEYFKQDPKVRENLEREIRILKLLRGCEYVVQLYHVQELKNFIVLVMELCDYDLDHLVKVSPFKEDSTIVFLYQLAQGMKALRDQNIVHRDLKPGNILIKLHPTTGKMMIKLADFGFARHFKDEGNKTIDMTSLAGTPVFMAPEALSCVFHPGEHYDDKVDIWSIGALLYKVLVGQCGFYAQLQDIPRILKHKGDAIAFKRGTNRKITYIYELPSTLQGLSESFRERMKALLRSMLKLDPRERMTFTEFFETVDDIICSKIEIINLLHGTSLKIISDPTLTAASLVEKVRIQWQIPSAGQLIFSTAYSHCVAPHKNISHDQFLELLDKSGGSEGHAKLYLLPILQMKQTHVAPDTTCFTPLKYTVDDPVIVNLVTEQKFVDEIVHMISYMGLQQRKQIEGLEEIAQFTSAEVGLFVSDVYPSLLEQVYQALAKVTLACEWLSEDMTTLGDNTDQSQLASLFSSLENNKIKLQQLLQELNEFNAKPAPSLSNSLSQDDITTFVAALTQRTKNLSSARVDLIQSLCKGISDDSSKRISQVTNHVKIQLAPFSEALVKVWSLREKSSTIFEICVAVNEILGKVSQERSMILRSISTGTIRQRNAQGGLEPTHHLPAVTPPPPGNWPPGLVPSNQLWADPTIVDNLKKQTTQLNSEVSLLRDKNNQLMVELTSLKIQKVESVSSEEESTLVPSKMTHLRDADVKSPSTGSDVAVLEGLTRQLKHFCVIAEKISPEAATSSPAAITPGGTLYPNLLEDYSVISMPSSDNGDLQALLPKAQQLAQSISKSTLAMENMRASRGNVTLTPNSALVKIGRPTEYEKSDIVLFTPVKTMRSKSTIPALLHLQQNKPFILMDNSSYSSFNIRPGKMPDLFFARLLQDPRRKKFEDNHDLASDIGLESGDFFCVTAEPVQLKFSAQRSGSSSQKTNTSSSHTKSSSKSPGVFKAFRGSKTDKEFV